MELLIMMKNIFFHCRILPCQFLVSGGYEELEHYIRRMYAFPPRIILSWICACAMNILLHVRQSCGVCRPTRGGGCAIIHFECVSSQWGDISVFCLMLSCPSNIFTPGGYSCRPPSDNVGFFFENTSINKLWLLLLRKHIKREVPDHCKFYW